MYTFKKLLVEFFNLCFPPENDREQPKNYELIIFYSFLLIVVIIGFTLLR